MAQSYRDLWVRVAVHGLPLPMQIPGPRRAVPQGAPALVQESLEKAFPRDGQRPRFPPGPPLATGRQGEADAPGASWT